MIKNYQTHASNERTYLAWIRTSIALIGLGFLVEKFEYYLVSFYKLENTGIIDNSFSKMSGLVLIGLAFVILLGSTVQFFNYKAMIDDHKENRYGGLMTKVTLSVLLGSLMVFLLFYTEYLLFEAPISVQSYIE